MQVCGHIELHNLATGDDLVLEEQCFGEEFADQLGPLPLDPGPGLDAMCSGEAYTCEVVVDAIESWDPDACTPYEDGGGGDGDGDGGDGDGDGDGDASTSDGGDGGDSDEGDSTSSAGEESGESGDPGLDEAGSGDGCSCAAGERGGAPSSLALGLLALCAWRRPRRRA